MSTTLSLFICDGCFHLADFTALQEAAGGKGRQVSCPECNCSLQTIKVYQTPDLETAILNLKQEALDQHERLTRLLRRHVFGAGDCVVCKSSEDMVTHLKGLNAVLSRTLETPNPADEQWRLLLRNAMLEFEGFRLTHDLRVNLK